jgi:Na+/proline symporter
MPLYSLIIIIITISFTQDIYTNIPETNNVPKEYIVAAILSLLFMVLISLVPALTLMYFYIILLLLLLLLLLCGKIVKWSE